MHIFGQKRVLAFNYILRNKDGQIIDASESGQPLPFLEGAGQILPALEQVILTMKVGDKNTVKLSAKDGYGEFNPKMTMEVPKEELAHLELAVGSFLQMQLGHQVKVVKISKIENDTVTLDGNHPLAGVDLEFEIELAFDRPATDEEVTHGHAHGLHGHAQH